MCLGVGCCCDATKSNKQKARGQIRAKNFHGDVLYETKVTTVDGIVKEENYRHSASYK